MPAMPTVPSRALAPVGAEPGGVGLRTRRLVLLRGGPGEGEGERAEVVEQRRDRQAVARGGVGQLVVAHPGDHAGHLGGLWGEVESRPVS
jgi:hypothetical protein